MSNFDSIRRQVKDFYKKLGEYGDTINGMAEKREKDIKKRVSELPTVNKDALEGLKEALPFHAGAQFFNEAASYFSREKTRSDLRKNRLNQVRAGFKNDKDNFMVGLQLLDKGGARPTQPATKAAYPRFKQKSEPDYKKVFKDVAGMQALVSRTESYNKFLKTVKEGHLKDALFKLQNIYGGK